MTFRCNRCDFRAEDDDAAAEHARETEHWRCGVCQRRSLTEHEKQVCSRCVTRAFDDLERIGEAFLRLPVVIENTAYHAGTLPGGDALVMTGQGAIEGGGPDDWLSDPSPIVVELHSWERDWRETFGHSHFPRWQATFPTVSAYLTEWLTLASRTHPGFDDFASELRTLRSRIEHVAGLADDPEKAAAECFDCRGALLRHYGDAGLSDTWVCADCDREYDQPEYYLALRAAAETGQGYVPLAEAARAAKIAGHIVRNWYDRGQVGGYCQVFPKHRHMVWWPDVHDRVAARLQDRTTAV